MVNLPPVHVAPRDRVPFYKQIAAALRKAIEAGDISYGAKLPNIQELARSYQTSVFTIQSALGELVKDGLIERSRNRGTFVTAGGKALTSVGIYFGGDVLHGRGMAAYRVLSELLTKSLADRGVRRSLWIDTRPASEMGDPMPEILSAASKRQVQGIIIGSAARREMNWLSKVAIPMTTLGSYPDTSWADMDRPRMVRDAMADLKRQGCRSVGVIFPWAVKNIFHEPVSETSKDMLHAFADSISDLGLKTKDSWVRLPKSFLHAKDFESFGYQQFQEIWKQPERPDGLLIYSDVVVRGSVTAMLQAGVSAPGDLKLVLHRNEGIPLLCPLPASWLETDLTSLAAALIGQIEKQLAGQSPEPVLVPHNFVPL